MTPSEELACFLSARSECLLTTGTYAHANWCIRGAVRLAPGVKGYQVGVNVVEQELMKFRFHQMDQVAWMEAHPGEPLPVELRPPMRKRKMNP
jgi:hypothetical protein